MKDTPDLQQEAQRQHAIELLCRLLKVRKQEAEVFYIRAVAQLAREADEKLARIETTLAPEKLQQTIEVQQQPTISDEDLAAQLALKRPASARFWRLKAQEAMRYATPAKQKYVSSSPPDHRPQALHPAASAAISMGDAEQQMSQEQSNSEEEKMGPEVEISLPKLIDARGQQRRGQESLHAASSAASGAAEQPLPAGTPAWHAGAVERNVDQNPPRSTVSIEEAAALLGYTSKYVKELRAKGVLKTAPKNRDRILRRSVYTLAAIRHKKDRREIEGVK